MKFSYTCPNCDGLTELDVTPPTPGRYSGPPEHCYPPEDGDFSPSACDYCHKDFDYDKVMDAADSTLDDYYDQGRGDN